MRMNSFQAAHRNRKTQCCNNGLIHPLCISRTLLEEPRRFITAAWEIITQNDRSHEWCTHKHMYVCSMHIGQTLHRL